MLGILKNIVTKSTLRTLYYYFIFPYLDYNLLNWSSAYPTNLDCLNISNKKAVRIILSKKGENMQHLYSRSLVSSPWMNLLN